jgi:transmembrane sensor
MPHRERASEIDDVATAWAAKVERGLTTAEKTELDLWLEGDSRRLGAFVRAQAAWIHAERAAALGAMPETQEPALTGDAPDEEARPPRLSRRLVLSGGGALAASVAAAYIVGVERYRTLESGIGEIRHIALNGGTTLTLDTDSRVDIALASGDRKLSLVRGRMFLDVILRQEMPFMVQVGDLLLQTAEGAFSLQSLVNSPIMALVTKGSLIVSQSHGMFGQKRTVRVGTDHAFTLASDALIRATDVRPIVAGQQEQFLAWRDGMLSFGGQMLADAVRAFDRYGPTRIVVVDPELARQKVTGLFKADDPRGFATAVAASFGAVVTSDGDVIRISAQKLPAG